MRYYYCVNCGHNHDYGFDRKKNIYCRRCNSKDYLVEIERQEYETSHPTSRINDLDKYKRTGISSNLPTSSNNKSN